MKLKIVNREGKLRKKYYQNFRWEKLHNFDCWRKFKKREDKVFNINGKLKNSESGKIGLDLIALME